ncbi:ABC transporter permease [Brachybacterium alimentarium]|uniref:ABC transporter permease n=1 Tax=Brachybacterium alimentarium TaxID=47845 RepID=UPI000DF33C4E|nr:polyketide antibiotic transporter [Brachybacterium alimentarium]RCS79901.1 polyketide antibiotic transporter [Brachybacterium alimentarium]
MTTTTRHSSGPTHALEVAPVSPLTGLGGLLRLYGRISRRQIIIWVLAIGLSVAASVAAMKGVYPDQQALDARAALLENPSAVMMTGPAFALDHYTFWAMVANELLLYVLVAVAIMSILLMVRHTRAEEEAGRLELVRALPVGRSAPPTAALLLVALANAGVGVSVVLGLLVTGGPLVDSLAVGLATALTGMVFGGVAALTAQVTEHAGSASGLALGAAAVAFMVRGIGDVVDAQGSWLSWFSPFAWAQQTRLFVDLRWWPLAVTLAAILVLLGLAAVLSRRRDVGAGLRPAAHGPATATRSLPDPAGLAVRLVTPMMVAWAVGLFLFAIAFGSLANSLQDMVSEIPAVGDMVPLDLDDLTTSFAAYVLQMLAIGPLGLIVAGILRLRTEEQEGRLAGILMAGSSRTSTAVRWVLVVALSTTVVQLLLGLGLGIGLLQATGETSWLAVMPLAALASLPAIALAGAVTVALYGLRLRLAGVAWLLVIWAAIDTFLGDLLDLPDVVRSISPLRHVPLVPDADLDVSALAGMSVLAVLLVLVGLWGLRRRDLAAG